MDNDIVSIYRIPYKVRQYICNKEQYFEIVRYAFYNFVEYIVHNVMIDNQCILYIYHIPDDEDNVLFHDVLSDTLKSKHDGVCYKVYKIHTKKEKSWMQFFTNIYYKYLMNVLITLVDSHNCIFIISEDNEQLLKSIEKLI